MDAPGKYVKKFAPLLLVLVLMLLSVFTFHVFVFPASSFPTRGTVRASSPFYSRLRQSLVSQDGHRKVLVLQKKVVISNAKASDAYFSENVYQPPQSATTKQRLQWIKLNWFKLKIFHQDELSTQFDRRMKVFLNGDKKCKTKFFMTWISSSESFGPRERLSLESVFKIHPFACLIIMSRSLDSPTGQSILKPFLTLGFRVIAIAPNLPFLFKATPAIKWLQDLKQGKIDPGNVSLSQNLSNLLRLAVLYKYGGIYIDSDIIVMNNLSNLSNAIGAQSKDETGKWKRLNNAVMAFDKKHPLLLKFIEEFSLTFNGSKWGHNGPYLVSRVVQRVSKRLGNPCNVLAPIAFYPVDWEHIDSFFNAPKTPLDKRWTVAKMQQLTTEALTVHLWNKHSGHMEIEPGSIIDLVFQISCKLCDPETLEAARFGRERRWHSSLQLSTSKALQG